MNHQSCIIYVAQVHIVMTHIQQFLEMKGEEEGLIKIFKSTIVTRLITMRSQPNCFEVVVVVVVVVVFCRFCCCFCCCCYP